MKILILMYHKISEITNKDEKMFMLSPQKFKKQMQYIKNNKYTPINIDDLQKHLVDPNFDLPERPVVITFDDGYMDNYENALPILQEYKFPATIFVVSGFVGKTNQWDMKLGFTQKPLMGWNEIREIKKYGLTIGSHTIHHPFLTKLDKNSAKKEIEVSKKQIEDKIGLPVEHFAYPYGDMNETIKKMVQNAGYKDACSVTPGFNSRNKEFFELRRLEIHGPDKIWQFGIKLTFGVNHGKLNVPAKYYTRRLLEKVRPY